MILSCSVLCGGVVSCASAVDVAMSTNGLASEEVAMVLADVSVALRDPFRSTFFFGRSFKARTPTIE